MAIRYDARGFFARYNDADWNETSLMQIVSLLMPVSKSGPWVAGGAIRRTLNKTPIDSDFDFFFSGPEQLVDFEKSLKDLGLSKVKETKHHIQYEGPIFGKTTIIQMIRFKYYQTAEEVIDSFDYTITQFAFDGEDLVCGDFSLWDLARNKLAIHKLTYPVASMRRLLKYAAQGFSACAGTYQTILRETATKQELTEQLDIEYVD